MKVNVIEKEKAELKLPIIVKNYNNYYMLIQKDVTINSVVHERVGCVNLSTNCIAYGDWANIQEFLSIHRDFEFIEGEIEITVK